MKRHNLSENIKIFYTSYPCLCEILKPLLIITRFTGILPVKAVRCEGHGAFCIFIQQKFWMFYSFSIQIFLIIHFSFLYGITFFRGPIDNQEGTEWYVKTFGYLLTDFETLVTIMVGCVCSKKISNNLENLSKIQGFIGEFRIFKIRFYVVLMVSLGSYCFLFIIFAYVAILRTPKEVEVLDTPNVVIIRGVLVLFPIVEVIIVFVFCCLLTLKYEYLADSTARTLEYLNIQAGGKNRAEPHILSMSRWENVPKFYELETYCQKLTQTVEEFNKCVGLAILASITSSLYSTVHYSYRLATATSEGLASNENERFPYVALLLYKSGKIFCYIFMGKHLLQASKQPFEILQNSRIVHLSPRIQQQVQTLMLQWLKNGSYLSAGGIVRVGPWLLAPILGNVITYLLVAIQFNITTAQVAQ